MNFGLRTPNRRGLSDIVSSILLILLVIIAIVIIWAFIRPTTEEGAQQVGTADDCLRIQLEVIECTYNSCSLPNVGGSNTAALSVRRTGRGELSDIVAVFSDSEDKTMTFRNSEGSFPGVIPDEGEFMVSGFFLDEFVPSKVDLAAVVGSNGHVCPLLSKTVTCDFQDDTSLGRCADTDGDRDLDIFDYLNIQNFISEENRSWDLTRDGMVDVQDFLAYCSSFSATDCSGCSGYDTCSY